MSEVKTGEGLVRARSSERGSKDIRVQYSVRMRKNLDTQEIEVFGQIIPAESHHWVDIMEIHDPVLMELNDGKPVRLIFQSVTLGVPIDVIIQKLES